MGKLFTSESVTEGHPDKIADQISDAILDELLAQDPYSRVAAETTVATGLALVVGEITTKAYVDIAKVAKDTIREIGYVNNVDGYNADSIAVLTSIDEQSADIALGVDKAFESKQEGVTEDFGTLGATLTVSAVDADDALNTLTVCVRIDNQKDGEYPSTAGNPDLCEPYGERKYYTKPIDFALYGFNYENNHIAYV